MLLLSSFRPSELPTIIYWGKKKERKANGCFMKPVSKLSVWRLCVFNPTLPRPAHLEPPLVNGSERPARCLGCDGDFIIFSFLFLFFVPAFWLNVSVSWTCCWCRGPLWPLMSPTENKCHIQPLLTRTDPRVTLRPSETKGRWRWMSRSLPDVWAVNPARPDLVYHFIY